jgi:hypothetical protein
VLIDWIIFSAQDEGRLLQGGIYDHSPQQRDDIEE